VAFAGGGVSVGFGGSADLFVFVPLARGRVVDEFVFWATAGDIMRAKKLINASCLSIVIPPGSSEFILLVSFSEAKELP
jgi:hypothetical protein